MTDKMSDEEFAAKCESEGVEYAFTEWGLSADSLADTDTELYRAASVVDALKDRWARAVRDLDEALEELDD